MSTSAARDELQIQTESTFEFGGRHLLATFFKCSPERLNDHKSLDRAMREAIEATGASVLDSNSHTFNNGGLTGVYLLAESHASIHTYPEHDSCFVDIFTCGYDCDPARAEAVLTEYLQPERVEVEIAHRGEPPKAR